MTGSLGPRAHERATAPTDTQLRSWPPPPSNPPPPTAPPATPSVRPWSPWRPLPEWRSPVAVAVVVVAGLADLSFRLPATSLAATLVVAAVVGLLAVAGRFDSIAQRCGAGLLLASGALLSIRASVWVATLLVITISALVVLVAADGLVLGQRQPWRRAQAAAYASLYDTFPWLVEAASFGSARLKGGAAVWARATAIAAAIVVVLGSLLASGDAAFGWLVAALDLAAGVGHLLAVAALVVPASALALLSIRARPEPLAKLESGAEPRPARRGFRAESLTALWATAATLSVWCGLQVAVVSGGARSVLAEQGITAAEYARQGFFQLVAVAALSLCVLNGAHRFARLGSGPDRAQRIPAVVIGFNLVVLAVVSFGRLGYYVGEFGMTMLRLSVATFLGWLALMTVLSVARSLGVRYEQNWLPTAAVLSAALFVVTFGAANPERWVAVINLERASVAEPIDDRYLTRELGDDAKEVVASYAWSDLGGMPDGVVTWLCERPSDVGYGPLGWNRARSQAAGLDCPI